MGERGPRARRWDLMSSHFPTSVHRFDREVRIDVPNEEERLRILKGMAAVQCLPSTNLALPRLKVKRTLHTPDAQSEDTHSDLRY